jgi:hypothetical protein
MLRECRNPKASSPNSEQSFLHGKRRERVRKTIRKGPGSELRVRKGWILECGLPKEGRNKIRINKENTV